MLVTRLLVCIFALLGFAVSAYAQISQVGEIKRLAEMKNADEIKKKLKNMYASAPGATASRLRLPEIQFQVGSSKLTELGKRQTAELATALIETNWKEQIVISAHTDASGSRRLNYKLSQARAASTLAYLIERGVNSEILCGVGKGKDPPHPYPENPRDPRNRMIQILVKQDIPREKCVKS